MSLFSIETLPFINPVKLSMCYLVVSCGKMLSYNAHWRHSIGALGHVLPHPPDLQQFHFFSVL